MVRLIVLLPGGGGGIGGGFFADNCLVRAFSSGFCKSIHDFRALHFATSPVMFSTLEDGTTVPGLAGVPSEGPVLLVGYHMLMGLELFGLLEQFLIEKNIMVRGIAHPELFGKFENPTTEFSLYDMVKVMGALPISASNFFNAFSANSHILLYPGGYVRHSITWVNNIGYFGRNNLSL